MAPDPVLRDRSSAIGLRHLLTLVHLLDHAPALLGMRVCAPIARPTGYVKERHLSAFFAMHCVRLQHSRLWFDQSACSEVPPPSLSKPRVQGARSDQKWTNRRLQQEAPYCTNEVP